MRVSFKVSFELPEGANRQNAIDYILDAVCSMKGCYRPADEDGPGDPMQPLDADSIVVTDRNMRWSCNNWTATA